MAVQDFESLSNAEYDNALNDISKELFTMDKDLDNDRVRLMQWGLINLLLNKGVITKEEFESSVEEATVFFKLLKRRFKLQNPDDTDDSTENA
jgi:hypothetical protein